MEKDDQMMWTKGDMHYWITAAMLAIFTLCVGRDAALAGMSRIVRTDSTTNQNRSSGQRMEENQLHSEFLMDLVFERGQPNKVGFPGGSRTIVPVAGGTFEGPGLKGTIVNPSGDWIVARPDSSSLLDMRMILKTSDSATIYVSWRGIAYAQPDGSLFARILPMFETGAAKYAWLNKVVAVGVYRQLTGKIRYQVFRIL